MRSPSRRPSDNDPVADRYTEWDLWVAPKLTKAQKARALDAFADEFASMSRHREPYDGWGEDMAYYLRRSARTLRGEPNEEWLPRCERQRRAPNGFALPRDPATRTVTAAKGSQIPDECPPQTQA